MRVKTVIGHAYSDITGQMPSNYRLLTLDQADSIVCPGPPQNCELLKGISLIRVSEELLSLLRRCRFVGMLCCSLFREQ